MPWLSLCLALLAALAFVRPGLAAESEVAGTERVQVRLLSDVSAVAPGAPFTVALDQRIIPGWHTYWKNPGDSGLPTEIDWILPEGSSAGPIQWPFPHRFDVGPITNYGYSDQVLLLNRITPPETLKAGDRFAMQAKLRWLVCEEICIPEEAEIAFSLPVGEGAPPSDLHADLEAARAALPVASPWPVSVAAEGAAVRLDLALPAAAQATLIDAAFFPDAWGQILHSGKQVLTSMPEGIRLALEPEAGFDPSQTPLSGVMVLTERLSDGSEAERALLVSAKLEGEEGLAGGASGTGGSGAGTPLLITEGAGIADVGFLSALFFALLGGIILNLMPCVFPVLSIKILSLSQQVGGDRREMRHHGYVYTAGVLISFAAISGLLLALRAGGEALGWGFQFQSPVFVMLMAVLFFALGLMLSGMMTVGGSLIGVGQGLGAKPGMSGSFFTGVLATLAATPCTAPFMGAAVGYAVTAHPASAIAVFLALGFGLALPYLLLTLVPRALSWLPKPGAWMERLKQVFAFPMFAAAIWLVWVLAQQSGASGVLAALAAMLLLAFAAWLYEATKGLKQRGRLVGASAVGLVLAAALVGMPRLLPPAGSGPAMAAVEEGLIPSEPFSPERVAALRAEGRPVFVDFTAAWCITCLVNEKLVFTDEGVAKAFAEADVALLIADWTNRDPVITKALAAHGRSGVPLYLFYPNDGGAPAILPQVLTVGSVLQAVEVATGKPRLQQASAE